jgi:MoxR-like ATPase
VRALLLEGAPGTGKTFLAECLAKAIGAEYAYMLCHNWLSDEELFIGVDVGAVAVGVEQREDAYRHGLLLRAVEASQRGKVVVCIDEIDKAPQRAESLLLDFLQTARVHGTRGEVWQGVNENIIVVLTSNAVRPLMEATLRRCFRLRMEFLSENVERDLLRKWTGAPSGAIRAVVQFANVIRTSGATAPSIQEMKHLLLDMQQAESAGDVEILLRASLVKEDEDWQALEKAAKNPAAALWGEWKR